MVNTTQSYGQEDFTMRYEIIGNTIPAVEITFDYAGESVYTQSGGMTWQTDGVAMSTNTKGGLMRGLGRMFAGESMFMVTYSAQTSGAKIAFASQMPGRIYVLDAARNGGMICQKGAFLCAQEGVDLNVTFTKKGMAGLFGGEGFILEEITGSGLAFLEVDGDLIERELAPGEVLKVQTGNVVGFEPSVSYEIESIKGLGNIMFGGEGLFITRLVGPGKVLIQTQSIGQLAGELQKHMVFSSK